MHEPLLERIRQLERSVSRWRLACFALFIVVVSLVAIGGTFGLILAMQVPDRRHMEMLRADAELARAQAQQAIQAERVAREQAERALQAERAARQPQMDGKAAGP
jgi:multidrug efflux pump subunit AcrA (membrane-fusion protein)